MKRTRKSNIDDIKDTLTSSVIKQDISMGVDSGSILLNLAMSDDAKKGYQQSGMINIIGSSRSGKTILAATMLAEACYNKKFDGHNLVYGIIEKGFKFNTKKLFGSKYIERVVLDDSINSVEDLQISLYKLFKGGKPFIFVLDSFDAMTCDDEEEFVEKKIKAKIAGKEEKGTFGLKKNKNYHEIMRTIEGQLLDNKSLLVVISQTRQNVDPFSFRKLRRNGEYALEFFSDIVMWLAVKKTLTKTVNKKKYAIGIETNIKISKNRYTGKIREEIPLTIYYEMGIDNLKNNVDYLIENEVITQVGRKLKYKDYEGINIIKYIEENNLESEVLKDIQKVWNDTEAEISKDFKNRKKRFE